MRNTFLSRFNSSDCGLSATAGKLARAYSQIESESRKDQFIDGIGLSL